MAALRTALLVWRFQLGSRRAQRVCPRAAAQRLPDALLATRPQPFEVGQPCRPLSSEAGE